LAQVPELFNDTAKEKKDNFVSKNIASVCVGKKVVAGKQQIQTNGR
jgi:hypothetical protein